MKILLITDQFENSQHSSTEGIFNHGMSDLAEITRVYFSRERQSAFKESSRIILPYVCRKRGLLRQLSSIVALDEFDAIIVRNWFQALKQCLKSDLNAKLGFWESFPHSYRRFHEAHQEQRAVFRKTIEYWFKRRREKRLLEQCDFYLPITETFHETFYPDLLTPWMALPMGVDFSQIASPINTNDAEPDESSIRFAYIGTVDKLRQVDVILDAFCETSGNFRLDIYTASNNATVENLKQRNDPRIRVHAPLPRQQLFEAIRHHDIGISLIPESTLYRVASPTKTMEYYALGIPALMNPLPEHVRLLPESSGFYCEFNRESIKQGIESILTLSRAEIRKRGEEGRNIIIHEGNYRVSAERLLTFIRQLPAKR